MDQSTRYNYASTSPETTGNEAHTASAKSTAQRARRHPIGTACEPCRQRKTKCDGERPVCGQCTKNPPDSECKFVARPGESRMGALKRENSEREQQIEDLSSMLSRSGTSNEVAMATERRELQQKIKDLEVEKAQRCSKKRLSGEYDAKLEGERQDLRKLLELFHGLRAQTDEAAHQLFLRIRQCRYDEDILRVAKDYRST